MDGPQFDRWTRRRFGLMGGGIAAGLMGSLGLDETEAKKHKHKKRCRKVQQSCEPDGKKKKRCCKGLRCTGVQGEGVQCCRDTQGKCNERSECCGELECHVSTGLGKVRCCQAVVNGSCETDDDCCEPFHCVESNCKEL